MPIAGILNYTVAMSNQAGFFFSDVTVIFRYFLPTANLSLPKPENHSRDTYFAGISHAPPACVNSGSRFPTFYKIWILQIPCQKRRLPTKRQNRSHDCISFSITICEISISPPPPACPENPSPRSTSDRWIWLSFIFFRGRNCYATIWLTLFTSGEKKGRWKVEQTTCHSETLKCNYNWICW